MKLYFKVKLIISAHYVKFIKEMLLNVILIAVKFISTQNVPNNTYKLYFNY